MEDKIRNLIKNALESLEVEGVDFVVEHPEDLKNGDYSTNVAMAGAKKLKANPKELAEKIVAILRQAQDKFPEIQEIQVAGAGFINFHLSPKFFAGSVEEILNNKHFAKNHLFSKKKIMIEYTDPNPFKPLHIGHLMTNAIGESIARILESSGAEVSRANYQGDVGLHVAKAIWGLQKNEKLQDITLSNAIQSYNIGKAYAIGAEAYEKDDKSKKETDEINKKIYDRSDGKINEIYDWGFKVTMEAFEDIYRMLGTKFDYYFLESLVASFGANVIRENIGKVFEESDGAVVFKADKYDPKLHTRVFITSVGLPTYEGKELGLALEKFKMKPDLDLSIVVTANEQMEYMRVVAKALSLLHPEYTDKMRHITHGMMRFSRTIAGKMSSRSGLIVTALDLLQQLKEKTGNESIAVAAIKYMILRQAIGGDIIFDIEKSVSTEGDSGVYLQYAHARANSVLEKAKKENILPDPHILPTEVSEVEKLLYRFPEVVLRAGEEYAPHYVANYLIELARAYNSFYGNTTIVNVKDKTSPYKVALTFAFVFVMKKGLYLLGIEAPERM